MQLNNQLLETITHDSPCLNFYLQTLDATTVQAGLHRHDFFQFILLTEGTIDHMIDFKHYHMEPHSVSVIFPHQLHEMKFSPDAKAMIVMFDETVFCSKILHDELKDYNIDLQKRINYISLKDKKEVFQQLLAVWTSINELYGQFNPVNKMQIKLFIKIMILKVINVDPDKSLLSTDNADTSLYITFREKVDKQFKENRVVNAYANDLHISVKRLTDVCRHFCGLTPLEVIHEKLNLELKKALTIGHLSLKEISHDFGFSSQAALNKYIEQKFALTPMQLKNKLRRENTDL